MGRLALDNICGPEILHVLPVMKAAREITEEPIQVYTQRSSERSPGTIHLS